MKKRVLVEGDIVHVKKKADIISYAVVPIGTIEQVREFDGVEPLDVRLTRGNTYKKAYRVRHQFGEAWYERTEIVPCMCRVPHVHTHI